MLGPNELLEKVMEFAKNKFNKGELNIYKSDLEKYVKKIDPEAESRNLEFILNELDARGWLLVNSETQIKFDPVSFQ